MPRNTEVQQQPSLTEAFLDEAEWKVFNVSLEDVLDKVAPSATQEDALRIWSWARLAADMKDGSNALIDLPPPDMWSAMNAGSTDFVRWWAEESKTDTPADHEEFRQLWIGLPEELLPLLHAAHQRGVRLLRLSY